MTKAALATIAQKNRIYDRILNRFSEGKSFLVSGHTNPDADCLATMVGVSLLIRKFSKPVRLITEGHMPKNLDYLLMIAEYNGVHLQDAAEIPPDTTIMCDTAKPSLLPEREELEQTLASRDVVTIEIDHHLGGDSAYIARPTYALVDEASSACSLLARLAWKLSLSGQINEVFTRNVVVALLTGMVGDTQMGKVLSSRRESRMYSLLTGYLDQMLREQTFSEGKFTDAEHLYTEMIRLSDAEREVWKYIMELKVVDRSVGYIALTPEQSTDLFYTYGADVVVSVTRSAADRLAEESGRLGLVVYYDERQEESLLQCRMRRNYGYEDVDLRKLLDRLNITDGGGHPGAIGFRFPRSRIGDYPDLIHRIVEAANELARGGS